VSNAFEKSRIATSVWSPASYDFMKSCSVTNSCVSHEYPSRGSVPVSMDFWYILVSPGASCLAHSFNILFGPEALEGFIFLSNFSIPSDRISRSGIDLHFVLICFRCFWQCFVFFSGEY
jgi:hypothetical protein